MCIQYTRKYKNKRKKQHEAEKQESVEKRGKLEWENKCIWGKNQGNNGAWGVKICALCQRKKHLFGELHMWSFLEKMYYYTLCKINKRIKYTIQKQVD